LNDPAVVKKFTDFSMETIASTPDQFKGLARAESERWGPIIKANHITLD
jgi:tripartite-type tricarboxylate transporter receptor subunit TctC